MCIIELIRNTEMSFLIKHTKGKFYSNLYLRLNEFYKWKLFETRPIEYLIVLSIPYYSIFMIGCHFQGKKIEM